MTLMHSRYEGGLRCLSIHESSGCQLITDAPLDNQGKGEAFSPTDLVATALASCILTILGIVAERDGIGLEPCTARVEKTMTGEGVRRIALLEVWISLPPGLDAQQRQRLERAGEGCPVKRSLEGAVPMTLHWD
ncbi:MAG: OsmC family protein [Synechococcaceae cyanobacterium ELA263]